MATFTEPRVCTITATVSLGSRVNIVDAAKHIVVSNDILAVRITYAGGRSAVSKGLPAKVPRVASAKRSFNNQVTFIVRLPNEMGRACCKVFHNGTMHVTGARSHADLEHSLENVTKVLKSVAATTTEAINVDANTTCGLNIGLDHVLYSSAGDIIGWTSWGDKQFYLNDIGFVDMESTKDGWVFVRSEWTAGRKCVYDLDGSEIGEKLMTFFPGVGRRYYAIIGNDIVVGNVTVGHVTVNINNKNRSVRGPVTSEIKRMYTGLENPDAANGPFCIHMVNTYFTCSEQIDRIKLHRAFLEDGYYSRFDPCVNPGVNLRFYDNPKQRTFGVCDCPHAHCTCKKVSLRCFTSGSLIVAGLRDIDHGLIIHKFISDYYNTHIARIKLSPETEST